MTKFTHREDLLRAFEQCVQKYMDTHEFANFRNVKMVFVLSQPEKKEWRFDFAKGFDMIVAGTDAKSKSGPQLVDADTLYFEEKDSADTVSK
jgi:hypothetical protein